MAYTNEHGAKNKQNTVIDGVNFKFIRSEESKSGKKIIAQCLLCVDGKEITGGAGSTGNFFTHLKRCHPDAHDSVKKRKLGEVQASQSTLSHLITGTTKGNQKKADQLILDYIVKSMRPLSTVSDPNFLALVRGLTNDPEIKVIGRSALDSQLKAMYDTRVNKLKEEVAGATYVCLTADCWSSHARSFLGVTCHWITEEFIRESRVLSCMRFMGTHSYDKIAEKLAYVLQSYEIPLTKVVTVVTDNGSNFCKAFREFSMTFDNEDDEECRTQNDRVELYPVPEPDGKEAPGFGDIDSDDDEKFYRDDIFEVLSEQPEVEKIALPPHFRCISHTLSLVATTDLKKVKGSKLYHKVMGKCTKLWNLSSSPKSAEIIIQACGANFVRPVPTRWNSLYNAVERLLSMKGGLDEVCSKLGVPLLSDKELEFLEEFAKISAPIANALDLMQGEYGLFMGAVLPTLTQLERKLENFRPSTKFCSSHLEAYINGVKTRFKDILKVCTESPSDLVFASLSNPVFKLRWASINVHDDLKKCFIFEARKFYDSSTSRINKASANSEVDSFFDFEDGLQDVDSNVDHVELECISYFNDPVRDINTLTKYPTIRRMFMRYNTSLPSSAPVERLFSYGGLVLSSRRCRLSERKFEQLLLLKCNSVFDC